MKKATLFILLAFTAFAPVFAPVFAQTTKYYFFDSDWKLTISTDCSYYRKVEYNSNGAIITPIIDYYKNGNIQCMLYPTDYFSATCASGNCGTQNGYTKYFHPNGNLSGYRRLQNGQLVHRKDYDINGNLTRIQGCESGDCENGYGTYYYKSGDAYIGYFSNGYVHGRGTYRWAASGNSYTGLFIYGQIDRTQSSSTSISAQDVKDGIEIATKLVDLYKAFNKN